MKSWIASSPWQLPATGQPSSQVSACVCTRPDLCLFVLDMAGNCIHQFASLVFSCVSGAGGGGCAFVVLPTHAAEHDVAALQADLTAHGFSSFETSLGQAGAVVLKNKSLEECMDHATSTARL